MDGVVFYVVVGVLVVVAGPLVSIVALMLLGAAARWVKGWGNER